MAAVKPNILFIMADQLRWDYLGCSGHPSIKTPNIDALARQGAIFTRAFVQAPVCGGSRMSFYTGRYNFTHGATYNGFPLRVDEKTIGDYLRPLGYRVALVGKSHFSADWDTLARIGVDLQVPAGSLVSTGGFEEYERDDGLHPDRSADPNLAYNCWLREKGYSGNNPWHDWANSAAGENGELLSGWLMRHANRPARVKEEHSETAYVTDRALDFIDEMEAEPWCLHLSYIKPHWPYIAPAPYHNMYGVKDVVPANRSRRERTNAHPAIAAFMTHEESQNFSRDEVRHTVIPAYMGLISQIDHHIGRVLSHLHNRGLANNTIIVFTSDHGDYLGDHWLGEKELFHEEIVRIPLIIFDPRQTADSTRGTAIDNLVEAIDLAPTFLEWAQGPAEVHRLEGRSLTGLIAGKQPLEWRDAVFSDSDFVFRYARRVLQLPVQQSRAYMVRTARWKYVFFESLPPQLFDLQTDPQELHDLGRVARFKKVRTEMERKLFDWFRSRKLRITVPHDRVERIAEGIQNSGHIFGVW